MDERAFIERFRRQGERRPHPGAYPSPSYPATWERFALVLSAVGGTFVPPEGEGAAIREAIARGGRCVASASAATRLSGVSGWSLAPDGGSNPHALADVELGILTAEVAVAENAALLLSARSLPERALAFLAQHLLVLVPREALVADLVTAQSRLPTSLPHHLTWMSGPSKTADIEQTLVIGAHGSRSLIVVATAG
jgi:L-lactate dehydrogenase complex protein LldG